MVIVAKMFTCTSFSADINDHNIGSINGGVIGGVLLIVLLITLLVIALIIVSQRKIKGTFLEFTNHVCIHH